MKAGTGASRAGTVSVRSLDVRWETPRLNAYDHIDSEDFLSALPADYKTCGQPLLVYVSSDAPEIDKRTSEIEQSVLRDETVALGARLFRAVRLKGDRIGKDNPHWVTLGGRELPRVVLVDTAGKKVGMVEGKELSASNLFKQMRKAAAKTYKADLEKVVKESRALLDEMDRIEAKQMQLAAQKKDAKPGKEKELAEQEVQLAQQMKDVQARETELFNRVGEDRKVTKA
jgi:hypothetical protein